MPAHSMQRTVHERQQELELEHCSRPLVDILAVQEGTPHNSGSLRSLGRRAARRTMKDNPVTTTRRHQTATKGAFPLHSAHGAHSHYTMHMKLTHAI